MGMAAILTFGSRHFGHFSFPKAPEAIHRNLVTFGPVVSEKKSFESVDGRTTEATHPISSPGAFGSEDC